MKKTSNKRALVGRGKEDTNRGAIAETNEADSRSEGTNKQASKQTKKETRKGMKERSKERSRV
tara:strand:- start:465 stop:653 length:189 start_codon:yes stop_codon:yes gene_type:complete